MTKTSDITAQDTGSKPTVHISKTDSRIAQQQGRGEKSLSTVKTEWAKESEQLKSIQRKKQEIEESDQPTLADLLELWTMI